MLFSCKKHFVQCIKSLAHQLFSVQLEHLCDTAEEMSNKHINDTIIN